MPLRYSYLVEIKRKEAALKALQMAQFETPGIFLQEKIEKIEAEVVWLKKRLEERPDLGHPVII